jgi:hypothetical protein
VECTNRRLKRLQKEAHPNYISICPRCGKKSLWHNVKENKYECLNLQCKAVIASPGEISEKSKQPASSKNTESDGTIHYSNYVDSRITGNASGSEDKKANRERDKKTYGHGIQRWLLALLLVFALCVIGLGVSIFVGSFIPLWLMFGFSLIYSIEKWLYYFTRRHKGLGKLYRLLLNLSILALLGLLVWSGIKLFSYQLVRNSLVSSLIFLAEFIFFIWVWRIVAKNSWRWPSMKLTIFSLVVLLLVLTFAGVQPMSGYKDNMLSKMSSIGSTAPTTLPTPVPTPRTTTPLPSTTSTPPAAVAPTVLDKIDPKTGQYKNYYLGLVKNAGVEGGNGCYDSKNDFIVLINNKNAKNPTYSELVNFLQSDKTDEFPYELSVLAGKFFYGEAEDRIDLGHFQEIIDGIIQPNPPKVCADFAERLHNEAEMAGIRCGYVIVNNLSHALDIFEATDKGLVFIDDTGQSNNLQVHIITLPNSITFGEPNSWDKVAYVADGKPYGLIDLKSALFFGLDYQGYEKWLATKKTLDTLETQYDKLAGGRTIVPEDTYNQLQNILNQVKDLSNKLGGFWDSLGTVTNYYFTWDGNWRDRK